MAFRSFRFSVPLLAATLFLPSCAYMQTHKNVKEQAHFYQGYKFSTPRQIYRSGGTWYIAATPAQYRLHHDWVHDNVFRKTEEPSMELLSEMPNTLAYHEISADTAIVLLHADGYADSATIAREISSSSTPWRESLPHATAHAVKAKVVGKPDTAITYAQQPTETPFSYRLLSGLDLVFVDVPGTLAYNMAVPFIAPIVFFKEFLAEQ